MSVLFWISVGSVLYIYLGYPALIWCLARKRPAASRDQEGAGLPACTVVIAAYNEEQVIEAKCRSVLDSTGGEGIQQLIVASDGSSDATVERALALNDPRVQVMGFEERRGKPELLNEVMRTVRTPVVVFTDARQLWRPDTLGRLLERFADPHIGVVSGELEFLDASGTASQGMGVYWHYEKFIRNCEGRFASVPGATGAIYALRTELYKEIPEDLILDDVGIPMQAVFQGARCVFAQGAVVTDIASSHVEKEAVRKRRTIAGNIQMLQRFPRLLMPGLNPIWWQYMSHKVLRLFSPFFLMLALISHVFLLADPLYAALLVIHLLFYLVALVGWGMQETGVKAGWIGAPLIFVGLNVSTCLAWGDALQGKYSSTWDRSDKE